MPVIAHTTRGGRIESRHSGAIAVCDSAGALLFALGDVEAPVFPRSAVKAFQALPMVESGIADRYGLEPADLALCCASHSGEPKHAARAAAILRKAGRDPGALECGIQWPMGEFASRDLARKDESPTALHNNCSGKHAGFVCLACGSGVEVAGYVGPDHPVQRRVADAIGSMCGVDMRHAPRGIDGCSIPAYALPLRAIAHGFARLATGTGLSPERAAAARSLRLAVAAHPDMVAGTGRFDTDVMTLTGASAFTKTGAEGVFCAALPDQGLGIAIKCADGAGRAAQAACAAMLARFLDEDMAQRLEPFVSHPMLNWNGLEVGRVEAAPALRR